MTRDQRRCLVLLNNGPVYEGAVELLLHNKLTQDATTVLSGLLADGLVQKTDKAWAITDDGRQRLSSED